MMFNVKCRYFYKGLANFDKIQTSKRKIFAAYFENLNRIWVQNELNPPNIDLY